MLKKFYACPSINKLTERQPYLITVRHSFQPLQTITACILPEPASWATGDAQKAAQYGFLLWTSVLALISRARPLTVSLASVAAHEACSQATSNTFLLT